MISALSNNFKRNEYFFSFIFVWFFSTYFSANLNKSSCKTGSANLKFFTPLCWYPIKSPNPLNFKSSSAIKKPSSDSLRTLIRLIAFLLSPSLNNKIQVPCLPPLPTLPLNWCNCAKPNLLAFSIIIKFALGKSIPTSITVVETSIERSLFKNFFNTVCLSSLSKEPWIKPTLFGNFLLIKLNFFFVEE